MAPLRADIMLIAGLKNW